jgi:hypothetical protein
MRYFKKLSRDVRSLCWRTYYKLFPPTFESLIEEAKRYGKGWRLGAWDTKPHTVVCANGHCIMGAMLIGRKLVNHDPIWGGLFPSVYVITDLLGIPHDLAARLINANDDTQVYVPHGPKVPYSALDREHLLKALGISHE